MWELVEQGLEKPDMLAKKRKKKQRASLSSIKIWMILCLRRWSLQRGLAKFSLMSRQGQEGKVSILKG